MGKLPRKTCSVDGCQKPVHGHGFCGTHYQQQRRVGKRFSKPKPRCAVHNCERRHFSRGYCELHYRRMSRNGTTELLPKRVHIPKPCSVDNCSAPTVSRGLCSRHYKLWWEEAHGHKRAKCSVGWCAKRAIARGLCGTHYDRWNKGGDPHTKSRYELTPEQRFWSFVDRRGDNDCWLWQGGTNYPPNDYGQFKVRGRSTRAHQFSYRLHHGPIPQGMVVCHSCDTPRCVNPAHLWVGTYLDNSRDRNAKGREPHIPQKLTARKVKNIRERYAQGGTSYSSLGRQYNVTWQSIKAVVLRKTWKHVD